MDNLEKSTYGAELCSELGVEEARALKAELLRLLERDADVTLRGSGVERVGTAAMQVLASFARELSKRGHCLVLD
ncbi:MAG: STAS domain-containing protein [Polyangiaceae bacterium]